MSIGAIADLIASVFPPRNPIRSAMILADLSGGGGRRCAVYFGGGVVTAIFAPPVPIEVDKLVFVCRTGPRLTDPYIVIATNYQVEAAPVYLDNDEFDGYGQGAYGTEEYGR